VLGRKLLVEKPPVGLNHPLVLDNFYVKGVFSGALCFLPYFCQHFSAWVSL
jgi:hypothetical protein